MPAPSRAAAKVVHLLKMRWRQENSFKYLPEHYGVEQLIQDDAEYHKDERLAPHPKRAQLKRHIEDLRMEILFQEAERGHALEFNEEKALGRRARVEAGAQRTSAGRSTDCASASLGSRIVWLKLRRKFR